MDILLPDRFLDPEFEDLARTTGWRGRMIPVSWTKEARSGWFRRRILRRPQSSSGMETLGIDDLAGVRILLHAWPMSGAELSLLVDNSPGLRWIHTAYTGAEAAVHAVADRPILVTNAGAQTTAAVAEHALSLLLALGRRLPEHFIATQDREWVTPPASTLNGSTLMVFGLGRIGSAAASMAARLGCRVIGVRDRVQLGGPEEVTEVIAVPEALNRLGEADFVLLALPATARTANLVDHAFLGGMKTGARLVNVGRPENIVDDALVDALTGGRLAAACLDVTRERPVSKKSRLYRAPNLWLTHHTAYHLAEGDHLQNAQRTFLENLARFVEGAPIENRVDLERGY